MGKNTRRHRGGGLGQGYAFNPVALVPGVDTGLSFKEVSSCMAADRPGMLSNFSAGSGGLPGMGGGRRRMRGTRGKRTKRMRTKRMRGGRYSFDLSASSTFGGTPWGSGIPQVMSIPCESARHNPLNQAGGVGGIDSAFYTAPTAGYSNTPSTWVGSTGAPSLLQTPYDAKTMNPACLTTGGGRRRASRRGRRASRKGRKGRKASRK